MMNKYLFLLLLFAYLGNLQAQKGMAVQRCADIDRDAPILNIYIDGTNNKWVADSEGLFLAQSPDFASIVEIEETQWSLLSVRDGNEELNILKADLQKAMEDDFDLISTAHLDKQKQELWIGTEGSGVFQFRVEPSLQLIDQHKASNSKLPSDFVQTILAPGDGSILVGTDNGLLQVRGKKEKVIGKYFDIKEIAFLDGVIWLVSDGEVLEADNKGDVYGYEFEDNMTEGDVVDIAFDNLGRLWIASEIVTRYSLESEKTDIFGPAEEYTSQFPSSIAVDSDNAVWVGTKDKGVYYIGKSLSMSASIIVEKELSCDEGAKDATLAVRASGGEPPYKYVWSNGLSGEKPANVGPGKYSVTVSDQKGNEVTTEFEVDDTRLSATVAQVKAASLGGQANGQAIVNSSRNNPMYKYLWDNGEKTKEASRLTTGEHTVTVSDNQGCSVTLTVNIAEELAPLQVSIEQTKTANCQGEAGAALSAAVSGGQGPFKYQWSANGATTETASGLAVGTYNLTVTDSNNSTASAQFTVEEPTALSATAEVLQSASTDQSDGQALVKATGGTAPFTFKWDSGESIAEAKQLNAGTHAVSVTDANGCTTIAQVTITEDILPLSVSVEQTAEINCAGSSSGALRSIVKGGKGPFSYTWSSGGVTGESANGLAAGTYQVTVADAIGTTAQAEFTVDEPTPLQVDEITPKQSANIGQADGEARVKASGGTGDYTYRWDNGETEETAKKLTAGTHEVTVTDEAGCSAVGVIDITEDILPLAVSVEVNSEISCAGDAKGSIRAEVSGGKGPFTYAWSTGNSNNESLDNLAAGSYQVTITDAVGTAANATISLEEPTPISAEVTPRSPANVDLADGKARVKASGGSGKYTYQWDTGETGDEATQLAAGSHTVTITDEAGCTTTASIEMGEDILPLAVTIEQKNPINCAGEQSASLGAEISGGKGPFQYAWSTNANGNEINSLGAGAYQVTVTDAVGTNATAEFSIKEPAALTATAEVVASANVDQADGKARVKVSGGTGKYTYQWDTGETGNEAEKLALGTHTVTVRDESGCSTAASIDISEDIMPLAVTIEQQNPINCAGEQSARLVASISGGKGPFQYAWSNNASSNEIGSLGAGAYKVTVTDAVGTSISADYSVKEPQPLTATVEVLVSASVDQADGKARAKVSGGTGKSTYRWDTGETSLDASQLAAGTHTVTVTDESGCTVTASIDITENILPLAVSLEAESTLACAGETNASLAATVKGGKGPFQYQWNTDKGSGEKAANVGAGSYSVTVTDAVGTSISADLKIEEPKALTIEVSQESPASTDNSDGIARARVQGGTGNYTYNWDNGSSATNAENLAPGAHTLTVTDANGCSIVGEVTISENILPLAIKLEQTNEIKCAGEQTAALAVNVQGGKGPFQYQWNQSELSKQEETALKSGFYEVTVTDATGASKNASMEVKEPSALTVTLDKKSRAFNDDSKDGKASVKVGGGTPSYTFKWDNGESVPNAIELPVGNHAVTVTDANNCTETLNVEIEKKILPELTAGRLSAGQTLQVSRLYFEADSTNMTADSYPVLNEIGEFLEENPFIVIEVGGHTNNIPPHEYCDQLSTARAKSVATYIVKNGIDPNRVVYKGYGKRQPKFSNRTDDGRRRNQRVEIKILRLN